MNTADLDALVQAHADAHASAQNALVARLRAALSAPFLNALAARPLRVEHDAYTGATAALIPSVLGPDGHDHLLVSLCMTADGWEIRGPLYYRSGIADVALENALIEALVKPRRRGTGLLCGDR